MSAQDVQVDDLEEMLRGELNCPLTHEHSTCTVMVTVRIYSCFFPEGSLACEGAADYYRDSMDGYDQYRCSDCGRAPADHWRVVSI
jgi:hypothetical protein